MESFEIIALYPESRTAQRACIRNETPPLSAFAHIDAQIETSWSSVMRNVGFKVRLIPDAEVYGSTNMQSHSQQQLPDELWNLVREQQKLNFLLFSKSAKIIKAYKSMMDQLTAHKCTLLQFETLK